jgi:hypothetical protein
MAQVSIDGDRLVVDIEGFDRLWALKSRLEIPLANVVDVTADPGATSQVKGFRAPGTNIPGVIVAGTFHADGEKVFWDVHDAAKAVVITLEQQRYARLVIEVDDPSATVALIRRGIGAS